MKIKTLYKTNWVSLRRMIDPDNGVDGYDYLHEDRCDGKIIAILPYRNIESDNFPWNNQKEYLLRNEITPCWGMKSSVSAITGAVEKDDPIDTAIMELAEEAGYEINRNELKFLDISRGTKSSDSIYYLYTVDLTDKEKTLDGSGDGSELERKANCFWSRTIDDAIDPLVYVMHHRVNKIIGR